MTSSCETHPSLPRMAGMTSVSGLALAASFWVFSSLPTCVSCCTVAMFAGSTLLVLSRMSPTCGQAGKQFTHPNRRGKKLHSQDGRSTLLGGIRPCKKGSASPRSSEREFYNSYRGQGICQMIGFARPRATNLRVPRRRFRCTFEPAFQRVSSEKLDLFWDEKLG